MGDFILRLLFFAVAPVAIVYATSLFPVRGALIDVGLALGVFVASELAHRWAAKNRLIAAALHEALAFESYYRSRRPRPFFYYLAYPILFPYWLIHRDARREFLVFRGYTLSGFIILVITLAWQYFSSWAPEISVRQYWPYVVLSLVVEMLLALGLLMPIATTVVWYHSSLRRGRLLAVLIVASLATGYALVRLASRRAPLVSFSARERVTLRTAAARRKAHRSLLSAARAAYKHVANAEAVEGDGNVTGAALDAAHDALESFYKEDEAGAFSVWASPRTRPKVLVVYFEARRNRRPIWVGIRQDGTELRTPSQLPRGAFNAMRAISQEDDDWFDMWPDMIDLPDSEPSSAPHEYRHRRLPTTSASAPAPRSSAPITTTEPDAGT